MSPRVRASSQVRLADQQPEDVSYHCSRPLTMAVSSLSNSNPRSPASHGDCCHPGYRVRSRSPTSKSIWPRKASWYGSRIVQARRCPCVLPVRWAGGRDDIPGWPVNADEADLIAGSLNDDHFEGIFGARTRACPSAVSSASPAPALIRPISEDPHRMTGPSRRSFCWFFGLGRARGLIRAAACR